MTRRHRADANAASVAVEVAVLAPAFVFLMLLVVYAGKVAEAEGNVERAAADAARAASLRQHPGDATDDARNVAADEPRRMPACRAIPSPPTSTPTNFGPGGTVTVTVTCDASMADVTLLGVPGHRTFTATAIEVIDTYRSDP